HQPRDYLTRRREMEELALYLCSVGSLCSGLSSAASDGLSSFIFHKMAISQYHRWSILKRAIEVGDLDLVRLILIPRDTRAAVVPLFLNPLINEPLSATTSAAVDSSQQPSNAGAERHMKQWEASKKLIVETGISDHSLFHFLCSHHHRSSSSSSTSVVAIAE